MHGFATSGAAAQDRQSSMNEIRNVPDGHAEPVKPSQEIR